MTKLKVVTSDKKSGAEQVPQSKEALVEQLAGKVGGRVFTIDIWDAEQTSITY